MDTTTTTTMENTAMTTAGAPTSNSMTLPHFVPASTRPTMTVAQIPCCLCGTPIYPNAANQCPSCLSQSFNLQSILQQGPGGSECVVIHQCRKCRRFRRANHDKYDACDMESPQLLALCLKHIPALQQSTSNASNNSLYSKIQLVDASFIWTEPHSMRLKLHLTVRTLVQGVTLQQRLSTSQRIQWSQCPDCNREYTHRTWQAIVQVRQKRSHHGQGAAATSTNTLALLEMALAKNVLLRQDVLQVDSVAQGFDFYFLSHRKAQLFSAGLQRILPCRLSTARKMVSEDNTNNTANVKYTLLLEVVPLCRHDLIVVDKSSGGKPNAGPWSGRLVLVHRLGAGAIHVWDASPSQPQRRHDNAEQAALPLAISQEAYYKHEKAYHVLQSYNQLAEFIVLDVELWNANSERQRKTSGPSAGGGAALDESASMATGSVATASNNKYKHFVMADVQVVRADGAGDEIFTTFTHLGLLLQPGDVVLGYDLSQSTAVDELMAKALHSNVVVPDVVLVKKIKSAAAAALLQDLDDGDDGKTHVTTMADAATGAKRSMSKAKERRRRRDQGKKKAELEESAMRMGLLSDGPMEMQFQFNDQDEDGAGDWAEELSDLERDLAGIDMGSNIEEIAEEGTDAEQQDDDENTGEENASLLCPTN